MVNDAVNLAVTVQKPCGVWILEMLNDFGLHSCGFFVCFYNFAHNEESAYPSFPLSPFIFFGSI
jgi:hypothetical protein